MPTNITLAELEALLNGPAVKPPPGVLSNFDNPPNQDTVALTIGNLLIIFASLAVLIRIYTRRVLLRSVGCDDCKLYVYL